MQVSSTFSYSSQCGPRVSACGQFVAYVAGSRLVVRNLHTLASKRIINLPPDFARAVFLIRWDAYAAQAGEQRLAVATRDEVRVFSIDASDDVDDPGATILPGKGEIGSVEWISAPATPGVIPQSAEYSEVVRIVVFSVLGLKATVWSSDGTECELYNLKTSRAFKCGRSLPATFSFITRRSTVDVLENIYINRHAHSGGRWSFPLLNVLDIAAIQWSPSGLWLAGLDNPAAGYKAILWAADGSMLQTYDGSTIKQPLQLGSRGARVLEWITAANKSELLLVGDDNETVSILEITTFTPVSILLHGPITTDCCVWEEFLSPDTQRMEYRLLSLPYHPQPISKACGISVLEVAPSTSVSELVAVCTESMAHIVWIWSIANVHEPSLLAVLSHSSPVRKVQWAAKAPVLLVVPSENNVIGVWDAYSQRSVVYEWDAGMDPLVGAALGGTSAEGQTILGWSRSSFAVAFIDDAEVERQRQGSPQLLGDDEDTRVRQLADGVQQMEWVHEGSFAPLEDTFHKLSVTDGPTHR